MTWDRLGTVTWDRLGTVVTWDRLGTVTWDRLGTVGDLGQVTYSGDLGLVT